ncbi:MAG: hypothetical protein NWF06_05120 [Candidatus Bathyarchaeota archaeon]|nr:hypothetical protein [Candidatus Bathyarchaeum sp.]
MTEPQSAHLKNLILKTIDIYNSYRSPESTAKFVAVEKNGVTIDFEGPFCDSCGVTDYFEDFIYELATINKQFRLELEQSEPTGPQSFRVRYKLKESVYEVEDDQLFREFLLDRGLSFKEYVASNSCTKDVVMFHFRTWLFEKKQATGNSVP